MTADVTSPVDPLPPVITMGDPGGIGPEIIGKLWRYCKDHSGPQFATLATEEAIRAYTADMPIQSITCPTEAATYFKDALPYIPLASTTQSQPGQTDPQNAEAIVESIQKAVEFCLSGKASSVVTMPINKSSLYKSGFQFPGHTEYLADLCSVNQENSPLKSIMMLANDQLRVVPVTVHIPLKDVAKALTDQMIVEAAVITVRHLQQRCGLENPRVAITGLNPHAGEDGMMGIEDGVKILPAIRQLQDMGIEASGPYPSDTLFHAEARADYDVALCMYHDQALIPVKTIDFHGTVNITMGLPIIRTSPDHGTALNIAGHDKANIKSSLQALTMAVSMAQYQADSADD